ncbi:MAG: TrmB family transcriptional regulator [Nitrosarchaeum sp.]
MKETLKEIGFTEYETKLYLSLLQNPEISAYELAEKTGLYRQVTYDTLKRLEEKGFVNSNTEGKSKLFKATDPNLLLEILNEKTENYKKILPELNKIKSKEKNKITVETYKGENVLRIALRDIINETKKSKDKTVLCTAVDESLPTEKNKTIVEQYGRDLIHYKIKEKVIIKEGTKGLFSKSSQYKKVPEKFFNENPIQIYGDNVQILTFGNPNNLIVIRNKDVSNSYRKQFDLMWSIAK